MSHQADITVQASQVTADHNGFVVHIDLASLNNVGTFWSTVTPGGGDIRCRKADGVTPLPREVVSCVPATADTGTGYIRVKYTGTLSQLVNTVIQLYADGVSTEPAATDPEGRNAVWSDDGCRLHFQGNINDSSGNNVFEAVDPSRAPDLTTPGLAIFRADCIKTENAAGFSPQSGYTFTFDASFINLSVWDCVGGGFGGVVANAESYATVWQESTGNIMRVYHNTPNKVTAGDWRLIDGWSTIQGAGRGLVHIVWDGASTLRVFRNGSQVAVNGAPTGDVTVGSPNGAVFSIGCGVTDSGSYQYTHSLNLWEYGFTNQPRSAAWIADEYTNLSAPNTFYTVSEPAPGGAQLAAAVTASAAVSATLARAPGLGAAVSGGASVAASLVGAALLTGALSAAAATNATLTTFPLVPAADLEASVAGSSSVQAQLLPADGLGGSLVGSSSVDAALTVYPGLSAQVAGAATAEGSLSVALSLSGVLAGTSYAVLESPTQWWWPRYKMTEDLSPIFELEEFAFDAVLNGALQFKCIFTAFYSEVIGGTVNMRGNEPMMMVEQTAVPGLKEGDVVTIESQDYTVRELQPSNTGLIRVALEWNG